MGGGGGGGKRKPPTPQRVKISTKSAKNLKFYMEYTLSSF